MVSGWTNFAYEADPIVVVYVRCRAESTRSDRKIGRWGSTYDVRGFRAVNGNACSAFLIPSPEIGAVDKIRRSVGCTAVPIATTDTSARTKLRKPRVCTLPIRHLWQCLCSSAMAHGLPQTNSCNSGDSTSEQRKTVLTLG